MEAPEKFSDGLEFFLYTDGLIEPENIRGQSFGHFRLEQIVLGSRTRPPAELMDRLFANSAPGRLPRPASRTTSLLS